MDRSGGRGGRRRGAQGGSGGNGDGFLFVGAGRTLLSADWSRAFSQPNVQAGPLQLVLYGSIGRSDVAVAGVIAIGTAVLVVAAAKAVGVRSPALLTGLGFLAVVVGLTRVGYEYGHPADAVLPLIWILAAAEARRDRVLLAAVLIGLCTGVETWGILGVAVLALAPRLRDAAIGALAVAAVAGALYVPFILAGHFAMGSYRWQVAAGSAMSLVLPLGQPAPRCPLCFRSVLPSGGRSGSSRARLRWAPVSVQLDY